MTPPARGDAPSSQSTASCVGVANTYRQLNNVGCEEAKAVYDRIAAGQYRAVPEEPGKLYVDGYFLCFMDPADVRRASPKGSTCFKYGPELMNTDIFKGSFILTPNS